MLRLLYHSVRNLRKLPSYDKKDALLARNADIMTRVSLLAELEIHYIYALRTPNARVGRKTPYWTAMLEYIDLFYAKFDVIKDLRPFMKLISDHIDAQELYDRFKLKID